MVIGISFGTVYSCISIPGQNGLAAEAIANEDGDRQIPSYVAFNAFEQVIYPNSFVVLKLNNKQSPIQKERFRTFANC